ncbi:MAG: hypothetical protein LCH61_09175 [Proteobacteria bacterium]|nr:hypothetical protein [Pseudomonadota bacterium]
MIGPFIYTLLVLVVAGIIHLSTVLVMPWVATRDGFLRASALARDNSMIVLSATEVRNALPYTDPAQAVAVCRFVLDRGPVRVRLATADWPTTILFLRKGAGIFHSLTEKAATQGVVDVVIATSEQMDKITALDSDDDPVQELRVTAPVDIGIVLVRSLVRTDSEREGVMKQLRNTSCEAETL